MEPSHFEGSDSAQPCARCTEVGEGGLNGCNRSTVRLLDDDLKITKWLQFFLGELEFGKHLTKLLPTSTQSLLHPKWAHNGDVQPHNAT
jgi:hypothetical protein